MINKNYSILACGFGGRHNGKTQMITLIKIEELRNTINLLVKEQSEYERLCELVSAEHNVYTSKEEIDKLRSIVDILLTGISSSKIQSLQDIKILSSCRELFNETALSTEKMEYADFRENIQ